MLSIVFVRWMLRISDFITNNEFELLFFHPDMLEKKHLSSVYFVVFGNLTDLCLTWTWFLMISGNLSTKCQRVWLQIRPTYMHRVKGIDFLKGYVVACSPSHARVQEFLSGKLQVCKGQGGGSIIFQVVHLLISKETYITWMWFSRRRRSEPPAFIRIPICFFFIPLYFSLCVKPFYTAI